MHNMKEVNYKNLNSKQKEGYNFHLVTAALVRFGYTDCIRMPDDWEREDFIARHIDGHDMKVQLKSRVTIDKKNLGKNLYIAFPYQDEWYLYPHDIFVAFVKRNSCWLLSPSWTEKGCYHVGSINKTIKPFMDKWKIK